MRIFYEKRNEATGAERIAWICIRGYDSGISLVPSDTFDGDVRRDGKICFCTGSRRISAGNCIFTSHGPSGADLHLDSDSPEGVKSGLKKSTILVFAVPLVGTGMSKMRAFVYGTLSGAVEPVGAVLTICLASYIEPVLTYLLAFAAGAMMYVVVEELIPETAEGEHSNIATIGFAVGFTLMMVLDMALG